MSLSLKTALLFGGACCMFVGGIAAVRHFIVDPGLSELEQRAATRDLARCRGILQREVAMLGAVASDYATWDETYSFVRDRNPEYIESNILPETARNLSINLIAIVDTAGTVVMSRHYDRTVRDFVPSLGFPGGALPDDDPVMLGILRTGNVAGLIGTPRGPLLMAAKPILTSAGQGPGRGCVIMGRLLDSELVAALGGQAHVRFDVSPAVSAVPPDTAAHFQPRGTQTLAVWTELADINGRSLLRLVASVPREMRNSGRRLATIVTSTVLALGLVLLALVLFALERMVLIRVRRLDAGLRRVAGTEDFSLRMADHRQDELGALSRGVNDLIATVETLEDKWRRARIAAESADHAKSLFLANMSHEIRTPLNGVLGMTNLLLDTPLQPQQLDYAHTVQASAESLLVVINDILDFSKIEAGQLEIEDIAFSLRDVLSTSLEPLACQARAKGLSLSWLIDAEVDARWRGDPYRLRQILVNLAGNAVKFTEAGSVTVKVDRDRGSARTDRLCFTVTDTGPGVAPGKLDALFASFIQADTSITRRYGGTGLGLAISKQLVELMQGTIGCTSEPGRGSTFWFTIALDRAADLPDEAAVGEPPAGPRTEAPPSRVLVVEDNPVNQMVTRRYVEKLGHRVDVVDDGNKALAALARESYDLVLMDVQMPELDGIEATRLIRAGAREVRNSGVRIIGLTAAAMKSDTERCLQAGMDDYLAKPVKAATLAACVTRWLMTPEPTVHG